MGLVSARIPDDLEEELETYVEEENLERSVAIRKLLTEGLVDWKKKHAADLLEKGEVSFTRAAEIAGLDVWSFADYIEEQGITWVEGSDDLEAI